MTMQVGAWLHCRGCDLSQKKQNCKNAVLKSIERDVCLRKKFVCLGKKFNNIFYIRRKIMNGWFILTKFEIVCEN